MKRTGNIWSKIVDKNNILLAIENAAKGKTDRKIVKKVLSNKPLYVDKIQEILLNGYVSSPYNKMKIFDGARQKERIIYKPSFYPDQIVHWCLMQVIEDIIQKGMYEYCCASVKGRGEYTAIKYIAKVLVKDRKNTKYYIKLDIKKFYPSIDKEILKRKFRKIIKDRDVLILMDSIVDSFEESGVPIGNYTSQHFANFFLRDFDHWLKEEKKAKYYCRYMDDMIIFGANKKKLHRLLDEIRDYLKNEKLTLKNNWKVAKTESAPIDFIGRRFSRGYTTIRDTTFLRIKRRIKKISKKTYLNYKDASAIMSYYGIIKHSNSYKLKQKYLYPYISIDKCKEVIRNESRIRCTSK